VNADRRLKLIRRIETDTVPVHDGQHFEAVLHQTNTSADVYADRAYPSQARESDLKASGYRLKTQQRSNHRVAKLRARVECGFAAITQMGDKSIRTVSQRRNCCRLNRIQRMGASMELTWLDLPKKSKKVGNQKNWPKPGQIRQRSVAILTGRSRSHFHIERDYPRHQFFRKLLATTVELSSKKCINLRL